MDPDLAISRTNRKGDEYYLTRRKGKGGRTQYVFSKDPQVETVDSLPHGYEVFEHPNGQVFLRRQVVSNIPATDFEVIEHHMREIFRVEQYILERKRTEVVIHFADDGLEQLPDVAAILGSSSLRRNPHSYSAMLRFTYDPTDDSYTLARYCFLGSIDGWMYLEKSASIGKLVTKYCKHLGKESFFDLM